MSRHVTRWHEAKRELFDAFASVAKVLSSGRRAEIVDILAQVERPVDDISRELDQTIANTSQHLQQLLRAGLVKTRRDGTRKYYSLSGPAVSRLWTAVRDVAAEHVANLDELAASYLGDRSTLTTVTRTEVYERIGSGDLVVIDVRPEAEFRAGHIAGATSVTLKELEKWLDELPNDCVFADNAVRTLSRHGFKAARLEEGYPNGKKQASRSRPRPICLGKIVLRKPERETAPRTPVQLLEREAGPLGLDVSPPGLTIRPPGLTIRPRVLTAPHAESNLRTAVASSVQPFTAPRRPGPHRTCIPGAPIALPEELL